MATIAFYRSEIRQFDQKRKKLEEEITRLSEQEQYVLSPIDVL